MPLPQRGIVQLLNKAAGEGEFAGDEQMKQFIKDQNEVIRREIFSEAEEKAGIKNFQRRMMMQQQEKQMEEALQKSERDNLLRCQQKEQEERLAAEMARIQLETDRDERIRRQIRESSLELRELQTKIKEGYTAKERQAQMAEKRARDFDEAQREAEIANRMKQEMERAEALDQKRAEQRYADQIKYQQDLERQQEERARKKQEEYEEALKEKLLVDEVVRKLHEEEEQEKRNKAEKAETMKNFIAEFLAAREMWKKMEREQMEEENNRIAKFAAQQRERESLRLAAKKAALDKGAKILQELTRKMMEEQDAKEEMERVVLDLAEEEKEFQARMKEENDFKRRVTERRSMQRAFRDAMERKAAKDAAEREEEEEMKRLLLQKFAEDDRIEQMNAQKRRMRMQEHKREVEKMIMERRAKHEKEKAEELALHASQQEMENERQRIIEEERQKLIEKHAKRLLGYLPKGIVKKTDLDHLGEEFKAEFKSKTIDPFDEEAWEAPEPRLVGSKFVRRCEESLPLDGGAAAAAEKEAARREEC